MSNQHANLDTAGEGKTGLYANRTRSQVPIQPSLFGNIDNLPKKIRVIKEKKEIKLIKEGPQDTGILFDPWSRTIINPLPVRPLKPSSSSASPKGPSANQSTTSSNRKKQSIISSKELDANLLDYQNQRRGQQSTSSKELGANAISDNNRRNDIIPRDANAHVSPLTSDDEDEIKPSHQDYSNIGHVDKDLPLPTGRSKKKEPFSPKNSKVPGFIEKWIGRMDR